MCKECGQRVGRDRVSYGRVEQDGAKESKTEHVKVDVWTSSQAQSRKLSDLGLFRSCRGLGHRNNILWILRVNGSSSALAPWTMLRRGTLKYYCIVDIALHGLWLLYARSEWLAWLTRLVVRIELFDHMTRCSVREDAVVSRNTVHCHSSGRPMSACHESALLSICVSLHQTD